MLYRKEIQNAETLPTIGCGHAQRQAGAESKEENARRVRGGNAYFRFGTYYLKVIASLPAVGRGVFDRGNP